MMCHGASHATPRASHVVSVRDVARRRRVEEVGGRDTTTWRVGARRRCPAWLPYRDGSAALPFVLTVAADPSIRSSASPYGDALRPRL